MTLVTNVLEAGPTTVAPTLSTPKALVPGDTIGVVMPSTSPRENRVKRGVKALERAGFKTRLDPELLVKRTYHRREDQRRADNLMAMWSDPEVKAIIAGTGGYGAVRVLQYLDPAVFRDNPKPLVGYSDITALHLWMYRFAGLRTFHGPTLDDLMSARVPTLESLVSALTTPMPSTRLGDGVCQTVREGRATGRLVGGNLSLVQQSIGTPYEVPVDDAILFLEETKDPMSVADERLLHLRVSGLLSRVSGIVFGHLSLDVSERDEFEDFLLDLVSDLGVPVLMNFPAGHKNPNLTLPLGTEVELVAEHATGWISYREAALILITPDART
jgi:muramoyltetrapeptide carboxypeptidase